jgi:hypothetical protein
LVASSGGQASNKQQNERAIPIERDPISLRYLMVREKLRSWWSSSVKVLAWA